MRLVFHYFVFYSNVIKEIMVHGFILKLCLMSDGCGKLGGHEKA